MTPLRIQCETCQTWLRVRDPGFLGEVHGCPRCGSMVLIAAPATTSETPSQAPEPQPSMTFAVSDTLEEAEGFDSLDDVQPMPTQETPAEQPSESPPLEEAVTTPASTLPVGTIASAVSLAIACVIFGVAWITQSGEKEEPAVIAAPPTVSHEAGAEQPESFDPPAEKEIAAIDLTPETESEDLPSVASKPTSEAVVETKLDIPAAVLTTHEEPAVHVASAEPAPAPIESFDPLEIDPEALDLVLIRDGAPTAVQEESASDDTKPAQPIVEPTELLDAQLAQAARHGGVAVRRGPSDDPNYGAPRRGAGELLALTLPEIGLEQVPLHAAIDLLSELSAAPVSLSPGALRLAGVDPRRKIDVRSAETSYGEVLGGVLKQSRLDYRFEGPQVVIHLPEEDKPRTVRHKLLELSGDDPAALAKLLKQIGPSGPKYDQLVAEAGVLPTTAARRVQYELLVLCERLRVARGLPQQSKYPRRLVSVSPSLDQLTQRLDRRTTFSFVTPTPLREVFAHWEQASGLVVLADWRSLSDADLGPLSTIECSASNRTWTDALDGVLEPLGLAWAPGGAEVIWIASREKIEATQTVDFYPVDSTHGADLAESVATAHPTAGVVYDSASQAVIVRAGGLVQRAIYEAWLAEVKP